MHNDRAVTAELFRKAYEPVNFARCFIENKTAIAAAGRGLRPAGLTVRALVRAEITRAGLAQWAASFRANSSIPKLALPSDDIEVELG